MSGRGKHHHGHSPWDPLYNVWRGIRQRCTDHNHKKYKHYGGRGVYRDERWNEFPPFLAWAQSQGWQPGMRIHRKDHDGPYSPENCQVVSLEEHQELHKRPMPDHGTMARYRKRCRCDLCKRANADYHYERRHRANPDILKRNSPWRSCQRHKTTGMESIMSVHIGYATRETEKFRFQGDPREVRIEISAVCAQKIAEALYALGADRIERAGSELLGILGDMGFPAS